jgi:hypothetical protein
MLAPRIGNAAPVNSGRNSQPSGGSRRPACAAVRCSPRRTRGYRRSTRRRPAGPAGRSSARRGTTRTRRARRPRCPSPRAHRRRLRSCATCVARKAAPPASTSAPATRPDDPEGGSRFPCRSLSAIRRTPTGVPPGDGPDTAFPARANSDPTTSAPTTRRTVRVLRERVPDRDSCAATARVSRKGRHATTAWRDPSPDRHRRETRWPPRTGGGYHRGWPVFELPEPTAQEHG